MSGFQNVFGIAQVSEGARPWAAALGAVALGGLAIVIASVGMLRGQEPFATWFYPFAWYGTLLVLEGAAALPAGRGAGFILLRRPAHLGTLLGWSAVTWLFFELLNFRLRNWFYVFVPADPLARWAAITLSFATVLPAILLAEAVLARWTVGEGVRWPALRITPERLRRVQWAGGLMLALPLVWPRIFFPLVWGGATLLLDPLNYRRDRGRSLLADLERGEPGRILRLLVGGALVGLLWELYNTEARGKWIYTVPGLEELKLFEMPVLGFLGFPPFALECFAIWQALVLGGVAVPRRGAPRPARLSARLGAVLAAALFSAGVLREMEQRTIASYTPRLRELPGVPSAELSRAGYDVFGLAAAPREEVAAAIAAGPGEAARWVESARLATLRGIGSRRARELAAVGILSVAELAAADPDDLALRLRRLSGDDVVAARLRVWIRAARQEAFSGPAGRGGKPPRP